MVNVPPDISPAQIRAARGWLNWSQQFLATQAGVSKRAIVRAESGSSLPRTETSSRIRSALEDAGLQFRFNKMVGIGVEIETPSELDLKE